MKRRGSGILLHISSLPSSGGIGDLGPEAYRFVDLLAEAHQTYWQILPLNPTEPHYYNSPYQSISAFAFNPLLVSLDLLVAEGLLTIKDVEPAPDFPKNRVAFPEVREHKRRLLYQAFERFQGKKDPGFEHFCKQHGSWLHDFALFVALKMHHGNKAWNEWPDELRHRKPEALQEAHRAYATSVARTKFIQYMAARQWEALKRYCEQKGVQVLGDLPIYVQYDSADVWTHPHLFKLDEHQRPYAVAGVPPDYFSATGQLWGNPLYNWDNLKKHEYQWWIERVRHNLYLFDFVRIDHFRGLVAYWEVPAHEKTAIHGKWIEAPVMDFFKQLQKKIPVLPIIAEDLGVITPDVREVMQIFELPGMKILMFAFGDDVATNPYIPHNLVRNCILYTGTHDNNTVRGWFENEIDDTVKKRVFDYIGREIRVDELHWTFIRMVLMSVANTAIIPAQDLLGLGQEARMNRPSSLEGNWGWRLQEGQLTESVLGRLRSLTDCYGRW